MSEATMIMLSTVLIAVITAVPATIAAINSISAKKEAGTARVVAADATQKIEALTINVDGRLSLLMAKIEESAMARGRAEGEAIVRVEVARAVELQAATRAGADAATVAAIVVPITAAPLPVEIPADRPPDVGEAPPNGGP
jgi:hypothetical protein